MSFGPHSEPVEVQICTLSLFPAGAWGTIISVHFNVHNCISRSIIATFSSKRYKLLKVKIGLRGCRSRFANLFLKGGGGGAGERDCHFKGPAGRENVVHISLPFSWCITNGSTRRTCLSIHDQNHDYSHVHTYVFRLMKTGMTGYNTLNLIFVL